MSEPLDEFAFEEDFNEEDFYIPEDPAPVDPAPEPEAYEDILDFTARVIPYVVSEVSSAQDGSKTTEEMQALIDEIAELRRKLDDLASHSAGVDETANATDERVAAGAQQAYEAAESFKQAAVTLTDLGQQASDLRDESVRVSGLASQATLDARDAFNASVQATEDAAAALEKVKNSAAIVRIDSSRGVLFKSNNINTVLKVTVFRGDRIISDILDLASEFGAGAYLEWQWQRMNEEVFGTISAADPRIGSGGFTLTLTPDDVDTKVVFRCVLNGEA